MYIYTYIYNTHPTAFFLGASSPVPPQPRVPPTLPPILSSGNIAALSAPSHISSAPALAHPNAQQQQPNTQRASTHQPAPQPLFTWEPPPFTPDPPAPRPPTGTCLSNTLSSNSAFPTAYSAFSTLAGAWVTARLEVRDARGRSKRCVPDPFIFMAMYLFICLCMHAFISVWYVCVGHCAARSACRALTEQTVRPYIYMSLSVYL